ncbi:MAG: nucleoside monophosphate kinase [Candidatus Berkelbacteria bacterium]|nr:nucleoside monophosphate kinase [Candidatus Berkelbacteria bacterium]
MENFLILIMGPQGSGKGTQGKLLADELDYVYAEMSPTLKEYAKLNLEDKEKIEKCIAEGKLVPDEIVMRVIKYKFEGSLGIILDGVPRNKNQATEIVALAQEYGFKIITVYIDLPDDEAIKRLLARKICPVDGYEPPYPESLTKENCDKCGAKLITRSDDKEKIIKKRLLEYHEKTEPMMKYLEEQGKIVKIDGMPTVPEVHKSVIDGLKKIGI